MAVLLISIVKIYPHWCNHLSASIIPSPLLNRFLHHFYISPYQPAEICQILATTMEKYHLILPADVITYLATFTPNNLRQAINLLKHVHDYKFSCQ